MKLDRSAQAALMDAVVFFVVMMVAASSLLVYRINIEARSELQGQDELQGYSTMVGEALFASTVDQLVLHEDDGSRIIRNISIANVLAVMVRYLDADDSTSFSQSIMGTIRERADLLIRNGIEYKITAKGTLRSWEIYSDQQNPADPGIGAVAAYDMVVDDPISDTEARITLSIWRA